MSNEIVRLIYPSTLLRVPIINQLIRNYDITLNILGAHIDSDKGWIEIQLAGNIEVIEAAIEWLKSQGVRLEYYDE